MKIKLKPAFFGLILIGLMLLSSLAFAFLQTIFPREETQIELPKEKIIDYELSYEQENALLKNGFTILKFNYNLACANCLEEKNFLEQIATASQFKDQIILQEIFSTNITDSTLTITSFYGKKSLIGFNVNKTIDALCDLVVQQPYECALRKV